MVTNAEFVFSQQLIANKIKKDYKTSANQNIIYTELYIQDVICFDYCNKIPLYVTDRQVTESKLWRDPSKW
jgi:hypothetical protein